MEDFFKIGPNRFADAKGATIEFDPGSQRAVCKDWIRNRHSVLEGMEAFEARLKLEELDKQRAKTAERYFSHIYSYLGQSFGGDAFREKVGLDKLMQTIAGCDDMGLRFIYRTLIRYPAINTGTSTILQSIRDEIKKRKEAKNAESKEPDPPSRPKDSPFSF